MTRSTREGRSTLPSVAEPLGSPALPCPECRLRGVGGVARIGNKRNICTTCNNFAQNVMRRTRVVLKALHEDEYQGIRHQVEIEVYRDVIARWGTLA